MFPVLKMKQNKTLDMTNGPFTKKIIRFAVPLVLTGLLQILYNTADTAIVGRFAGGDALAAVGATGSLINLIINVFMGFSTGSGVMSANYIGADDKKRVHRCTHTAMSISLIFGVLVAIIGFFFAKPMLRLMNSPENVIDLSTLYLKIYFMGAPGSLVYNFGASLVRATGDTKKPLYILSLSGIVNVILNLILVIPFKMGVSGVAIATVVSQYISAVMIVAHLTKMNGASRLEIRRLRIYKHEFMRIFRIGFPAGLQNSLFSISNVIIQSAVNSFGSIVMAGITAGSNFDSYIYTCTNAVAQTSMTFTSQNLGAGKKENIMKIYRRCMLITTIAAFALSMVGLVFREPLVKVFSSEPEVIAVGVQRFELVIPFYVFCSLLDVASFQLRGMGKSFEPMLISLFGTCGLRLFWMFVILPMNSSLEMLFLVYPVSWFVSFVLQAIAVQLAARKYKPKLI